MNESTSKSKYFPKEVAKLGSAIFWETTKHVTGLSDIRNVLLVIFLMPNFARNVKCTIQKINLFLLSD